MDGCYQGVFRDTLMSLTILHGCCTIQVYRKISGSNAHPGSIVWEVCANTLVSEACFPALNQERWLLQKNGRSSYVRRVVYVGGKNINIMMSREILSLPRTKRSGGDEADHKNHETFDNRVENLRVGTPTQNQRNKRKWGSVCRFKGVVRHRAGFRSVVRHEKKRLMFGTFKTDVEAAVAYNIAARKLHGEFFHGSEIPEDEMPPEERQKELRQSVFEKLAGIK
jgi:hypothetical protein